LFLFSTRKCDKRTSKEAACSSYCIVLACWGACCDGSKRKVISGVLHQIPHALSLFRITQMCDVMMI
jgi:hypothetical protein